MHGAGYPAPCFTGTVMSNFVQMKNKIGSRLGDTSTPSLSLYGDYINDVVERLLAETGAYDRPAHLLRTVSGQFAYGLTADLFDVQEPMTMPGLSRTITPLTRAKFERHFSNPNTTGSPEYFIPLDRCGVSRQPASKLCFVSNNVNDTQVVTVRALSDYRWIEETVTLTGTTRVLTSYAYHGMADIVLSSVAVGTITITANSSAGDSTLPTTSTNGSVTIGTITVGATRPSAIINPGSLIRMVSTSASDTAVSAVVEGETIDTTNALDSIEHREVKTLNGTTEVQTTARFSRISRVSKTSDTVGTLIVKADPGARIIAVIPSGKRMLDIHIVGFYPVPTGEPIHYFGSSSYLPMVNDGDRPPLPESVHYIVEQWAETLARDAFGDRQGLSHYVITDGWRKDVMAIRHRINPSTTNDIVIGRRAQSADRRGSRMVQMDDIPDE